MKEKDKIEKLRTVEFVIDDAEGSILGDLSLISIVRDPAIEKSFHLFSKEKEHSFAKIDFEKQIIVGPAMTANKNILRYNKETDTYFNCFFSEETVVKCSELFFKNSNHTKTSLEHSEVLGQNQIKDAYVTQSWIVQDPAKDTAISYGFTPSKGDWFIAMKIESPVLWNIIKTEGFSGFSIEGDFAEKFSHIFKQVISPINIESKIKEIVYNKDINDIQKEIEIKKLL